MEFTKEAEKQLYNLCNQLQSKEISSEDFAKEVIKESGIDVSLKEIDIAALNKYIEEKVVFFARFTFNLNNSNNIEEKCEKLKKWLNYNCKIFDLFTSIEDLNKENVEKAIRYVDIEIVELIRDTLDWNNRKRNADAMEINVAEFCDNSDKYAESVYFESDLAESIASLLLSACDMGSAEKDVCVNTVLKPFLELLVHIESGELYKDIEWVESLEFIHTGVEQIIETNQKKYNEMVEHLIKTMDHLDLSFSEETRA